MARALGANARYRMKFETSYGVVATGNFAELPFVSVTLGEQQDLIASDLLGFGRNPQAPGQDVVNNQGQAVVPVDLRNFGYWLKLVLGAAVSDSQGVAASGSYVFSAQPTNNSTITIGGTVVTFVTATPTAGQVKIAATLADTLTNLAAMLNKSADTNLVQARYTVDTAFTTLNVVFGAVGTSGNSFTIVASSSPDSKATASGATLAGGSASGPYNHVFVPGSVALASASGEIAAPEVPSYAMNYGIKGSMLEIQLQRSGQLNATVTLIAQGETLAGSTGAGTPTDMVIERFAQGAGQVLRDGAPIGSLVSGSIKIDNGLDPVEVIRPDGRIAGADEGIMAITGSIVVRFDSTALMDLAAAGTPVDLQFGWQISAAKRLLIEVHKVYLPRPQKPVTGPKGVQATFNFQASEHDTLAKTLTATLVNDVASY